eukprot:Polyplicarium_translucidae@DN3527_c0_g1_i1.p1
MIGSRTLESLDAVARRLVVVGDFLQLAPVFEDWAFTSAVWNDVVDATVVLRTNWRQEADPAFFAALQELRVGQPTDATLGFLGGLGIGSARREALQLVPTNRAADAVNKKALEELIETNRADAAAECTSYRPQHSGLPDVASDDELLTLATGAPVILTQSLPSGTRGGVPNGTRGTVVGFYSLAALAAGGETERKFLRKHRRLPVVRFDGRKDEVKLRPALRGDEGGGESVHLPLRLAWALTVHRAQGMTVRGPIDVTLEQSFACGQAFVALSRAESSAQLRIVGQVDPLVLRRVDAKAVAFYGDLEAEGISHGEAA